MINNLSLITGERLWASLTILGDPVIVLCLVLSTYALIPQVTLAILPALVIGGSTVMSLKWLLAVVRPPGVLQDIIIIGQPPVSGAFPSGHSTGAFALATLLILLTPGKHLKFMMFSLASIVAVSRVVVGAHWPLDVSGGIVLGWVSAILGLHISKSWKQTPGKTRAINLLLLVFSVYLFFRNTGYTQAQVLQFAIAISGTVIAFISLTVLLTTPQTKNKEN